MPRHRKISKATSVFQSLFNYSIYIWALSMGIFIVVILIALYLYKQKVVVPLQKSDNQAYNPLSSPTPLNNQQQAQPQDNSEPWGVAKEVGPHTYTVKVGMDPEIATPQEAFAALNEYRYKNGKEKLNWSDNLASYAKSRADYYNSIDKTDAHEGFNDFLNNQDGFNKLGFYHVGENSSYGYRLNGVHLIEWMYASDEGHNANQLNSDWSSIGIGISGTSTDFIFGGN